MIPKIIEGPHNIRFDIDLLKRIYIENSFGRSFVRINPIEHDELVPLLYALTGSNKMNEYPVNGIYYNVYNDESECYDDCIGYIDHKDVKKVRKDFISALLSNVRYITIDNLSSVEYIPNKGIEIPQDFMGKKSLLADIQCNLSKLIKEKIEKDNEIGLMIVE